MSVRLNSLDIEDITLEIDVTAFFQAMSSGEKQEMAELLIDEEYASEFQDD